MGIINNCSLTRHQTDQFCSANSCAEAAQPSLSIASLPTRTHQLSLRTRHPLENNRPRRPLLKTSQQHTLKTTLQQILHSTLSNGSPTFCIAAAAAKIDSTRADSPVCLVRWTLDSPLLYRQIRLVLHHLQRRFAMGQILLPHCVRLSSRDIRNRRLQGFPCSLKGWSKGTRQPSCPGFR